MLSRSLLQYHHSVLQCIVFILICTPHNSSLSPTTTTTSIGNHYKDPSSSCSSSAKNIANNSNQQEQEQLSSFPISLFVGPLVCETPIRLAEIRHHGLLHSVSWIGKTSEQGKSKWDDLIHIHVSWFMHICIYRNYVNRFKQLMPRYQWINPSMCYWLHLKGFISTSIEARDMT